MAVCASSIPEPFYTITEIIGFVEELRSIIFYFLILFLYFFISFSKSPKNRIKSDPEQNVVKDRMRASRASNNQRKHVLDKLAGFYFYYFLPFKSF